MMLGFVISAIWGYALFSLDLLVLIIQRLDWGSGILLACEYCSLEALRVYGSYVLEKIPITPYSGTLDKVGCYGVIWVSPYENATKDEIVEKLKWTQKIISRYRICQEYEPKKEWEANLKSLAYDHRQLRCHE